MRLPEGCTWMTAERLLRLNGDLGDPERSGLMDVIRRFHSFCRAHDLSYCVIGGMAVVRDGAPRTTADVDILTLKEEWTRLLPLEGELRSIGIDTCVDTESGVKIDILFVEDDWGMVMPMPDPRMAGEYDEEARAFFMGLHDLVQLKMAVYLSKLTEYGKATAAKDLGDVHALIKNNLPKFSKEVLSRYHPALRDHCLEVYEEVQRSENSVGKRRRDGSRQQG